MLHSISHLNHVCGSWDIFHFWKLTFCCYFYLCPILHVLISTSNWSFQHFIILTSGLHHKSTVRKKTISFIKRKIQDDSHCKYQKSGCTLLRLWIMISLIISLNFKFYRWTSRMDDIDIIILAKICILMHSSVTIYENAMVIMTDIWLTYKYRNIFTDSFWKTALSYKRTLGFIFWRRRHIARVW